MIKFEYIFILNPYIYVYIHIHAHTHYVPSQSEMQKQKSKIKQWINNKIKKPMLEDICYFFVADTNSKQCDYAYVRRRPELMHPVIFNIYL